jgi:predicted nucleic acid-binding protein
MVGIDANILSLFLFPSASAPNDFRSGKPIDQAHERAEFLIAQLQQDGEIILIPTPALSEVLAVVPDINACVQILQSKGCFKIGNFGERAAVELALRLQAAIKGGDKFEGVASPWQKVKYDRQIIAICKVEGCSRIYSTDQHVHKHAALWKIPILNLSDVKLTGQLKMELIETSDEEVEADSTIENLPPPAPDAGSTSGSLKGETGAETTEGNWENEGGDGKAQSAGAPQGELKPPESDTPADG